LSDAHITKPASLRAEAGTGTHVIEVQPYHKVTVPFLGERRTDAPRQQYVLQCPRAGCYTVTLRTKTTVFSPPAFLDRAETIFAPAAKREVPPTVSDDPGGPPPPPLELSSPPTSGGGGVLKYLPGVRTRTPYPASLWPCPGCQRPIAVPNGDGAEIGVCQECSTFYRMGEPPEPVIAFRCDNCEAFLYSQPLGPGEASKVVGCPNCGHTRPFPRVPHVERNKWLSPKQVVWPCYTLCSNCMKIHWADDESTGMATCCLKCKAVMYIATQAEMERQRKIRQKVVRVAADVALASLAVMASGAASGPGPSSLPYSGPGPADDHLSREPSRPRDPIGPAPPSGPVPSPQAVALVGAVVIEDDGGLFVFKKKCERCGHLDSGSTRTQKLGGVVSGSFTCVHCRNLQEYRIRTG
jgi:hypothetical protein